MTHMLTQISEAEFSAVDPIFRVIVHDHPRKFGSLRLPDASHALTLCWRSELVDPIVVSDPSSSAVWIGVDQRLACVSPMGNTLFSIGVSSSVLQIRRFEKYIVALCEAQILALNRDYTLRKLCDLRDLPDQVDVDGDELVVTFTDGHRGTFSV